LLLSENEKTNHQAGIINLFDTVFIETNKIELQSTLKDLVFQINKEPSEEFARKYIRSNCFFDTIEAFRLKDLSDENNVEPQVPW
jgi:sulfite reductase (ferredoxin)